MVNGIIRISDHDVDLQKWCEQNKKFDFGISFVIEETRNIYNRNTFITIPEKSICIYEYDFSINRKIIDTLDKLISNIIQIKINKKYKVGLLVLGKSPKVISNSSLYEKIMSNIKKIF